MQTKLRCIPPSHHVAELAVMLGKLFMAPQSFGLFCVVHCLIGWLVE